MNEPRVRERPETKQPSQVYAAQHVGPGSRAHIQEIARCCDDGAEAIFIERWNLIMVRWTYSGMGLPTTQYTAIKQNDWLVYFVNNDSMGEMADDQFHRLFERIK
jgi:hypothetical protein